jgi:hypothetical protein
MQMQRTDAYRFTTISNSCTEIDELRKEVKIMNARAKLSELISGKKQQRYRVVVRGRLGKHNVHAPLYRRGGSLHRFSSQTIRPEHATRFDVYVHSCWR